MHREIKGLLVIDSKTRTGQSSRQKEKVTDKTPRWERHSHIFIERRVNPPLGEIIGQLGISFTSF